MKPITTQDIDWYQTAPVVVEVIQDLDASPDEVWEVIADHERWPEWFSTLKKVEVLGPAEGVGGRRRVFLPGAVFDEEFLAWEPGKRFAFTVTHVNRGPLESLCENLDLEDLGDGRTRLTYTQGFAAKPRFGALVKLMRGSFEKGLRNGLAGLAEYVQR